MKKLLVTGASGLLGSACVAVFEKEFHIFTSNGVDLRNRRETRALFGDIRPQYVIHCAAKVGGVKANRDNPVVFIQDNVAINGNVIDAAHEFGVEKLVNIGTSCMFPKHATIPVREDSYMTGPLEPDVEAYAQAKILAYSLCNAYRHQYGCNFVTVTPANLYGPNDSYGEGSAHVIPALVRKAAEANVNGTKMKVWGDGSAIREFLHSHDAARAIKAVLEKWDSPELISIGSGEGTSILQLAGTIAAMFGDVGIEWVPSEPTGIQTKTFDVTRLKSLGWKQEVPLVEGLAQVCYDYENNLNIRKNE